MKTERARKKQAQKIREAVKEFKEKLQTNQVKPLKNEISSPKT